MLHHLIAVNQSIKLLLKYCISETSVKIGVNVPEGCVVLNTEWAKSRYRIIFFFLYRYCE